MSESVRITAAEEFRRAVRSSGQVYAEIRIAGDEDNPILHVLADIEAVLEMAEEIVARGAVIEAESGFVYIGGEA